jgi:predicted  nucleic acid-binding Zn-ribbon protein
VFTSIGHGDDAVDHAVHAVRKHNKNAAAALWLLEPWLDAELCRRAERSLRDASRLLREPRRAVALTHTLRLLSSDEKEVAPEALQSRLSSERLVSPELLTEVAGLLDDALRVTTEFGSVEASEDDIKSRVKQATRRLRQKTRAARGERSPKQLHALRKALKRHAALHLALQPLVQGNLDRERLEALADHLGKFNDLRDLRKQVRKSRRDLPKGELKSLEQRMQKRQAKELRVSRKLARKLVRRFSRNRLAAAKPALPTETPGLDSVEPGPSTVDDSHVN